jgi:membrane protein implicated in regulation of membrane protease activity
MAGLFLQGGFVLLSALMLGSGHFSRWTAYAGMLANGLDFVHVLLGLVLPAVAILLLSVGGLFYLLWFPLLGRDLLRLGRRSHRVAGRAL